MRIAAVIPAYNEAEKIGDVVRSSAAFVDTVFVVDDGSTDATADVARDAGATVLRHVQNAGAGAATMTGLEAARRATFDVVVTLDADGQHNPDDIPALLEPIRDGQVDIVFANRFGQRNKIPFIRRVFNGLGNIVTFFATGSWIPDSQCGLKAFGPKALSQVQLRMSGFEFCTEIVRESTQHKWRITSIPTKVLYSEYTLAKGQSFAGGVRTAFKILLRSFLR